MCKQIRRQILSASHVKWEGRTHMPRVRTWVINVYIPRAAEEAFTLGNEEFVKENWKAALEHFSRAADLNQAKSEYALHKAAAMCKVNVYTNASDIIRRANSQSLTVSTPTPVIFPPLSSSLPDVPSLSVGHVLAGSSSV